MNKSSKSLALLLKNNHQTRRLEDFAPPNQYPPELRLISLPISIVGPYALVLVCLFSLSFTL